MQTEHDFNNTLNPEALGWGGGVQRSGIQTLISVMAPVLEHIKSGATLRETSLKLPFDEVIALNQTTFPLARLPAGSGGHDATIPELFGLVISVAEADPNIAQALRSHFGFVEHILTLADEQRRNLWVERLKSGVLIASAATEAGKAQLDSFGTRLDQVKGEWRLNGAKAYATGAIFADWIEVEATCESEGVAVMVQRSAQGVNLRDDWDGMGQRLSASGTIKFDNVLVEPKDVVHGDPFPYYESFYQLYLLAVMAGIGRAASNEASATLRSRERTFSHGTSRFPRDDPQLQQIVGEVRSSAYAAGAVVLHASHSLEHAYKQFLAGSVSHEVVATADIEVWQAQQVVSDLVLSAATRIFDALGGSATLREKSLDRHWRNARTLVSHNPVAFKTRIIGDFAVNGTPPPGQWRVGTPPWKEK
jgi:alkylation response protein AidB-like acyl-CoA dehydrogenase